MAIGQEQIEPIQKTEEENMDNFFDFFDLPETEVNRLKSDLEEYRTHKSEIIHNTWGKRIASADAKELIIHETKLDAVFEVDPLLKGDEHFYEAMQSKLTGRHYQLFKETGNMEHKLSITEHVERTHDWLSQHGRIGKWKKEFKEPIFTGQRLKLRDMPKFEGDVTDFDSFKAALYSFRAENINKAKSWLEAIKQKPDELIPNVRKEDRGMVYGHREAEIRMFKKLLDKKSFYFQVMVESQEFTEAEAWLAKAKSEGKYDDGVIDHRERELFRAYCVHHKWAEAKQVVENTEIASSKEGRQNRLTELSGRDYDSI